ncbi:MAG TPA: family 78 glycoside hydrolase catalytic domain [Ohtaekwangia sp.]|nr:family 78 glycoside hydrolase catalytic domain [Ohtaekwangia sp.]
MKFIIVLTLALITHVVSGQSVDPDLLSKKWNAFWIEAPGTDPLGYGVYLFRKVITLSTRPDEFVVHVSADNRYKLFVNGDWVAHGPARGDLYHWNFETIDLAPQLKAGENIITAVVWNFGDQRPEAQISFRTAFILQGNAKESEILNTNKSWSCQRDERYTAVNPDLIYTYYVSGPGERIDYNKHDLSTAAWIPAYELWHGIPKGVFDWSYGWMLIPRSIPMMELKPHRLNKLRKAEGITVSSKFPSTATSITFPPRKKTTLILDQGHLTNAYPVLKFRKGKHAVITLRYAEALYKKENTSDWKTHQQKGNRDEIEGKRFVGVHDQLISNGEAQTFTPLWWRTYRYLQLEVETKEDALIMDDLYGIFTGYPFEVKSAFDTSDKTLSKIHETGWRTARLCAGETYMDCPYYEQLQYVGDTRIQALVSLFNTGDDKLVRQAIDQLDHSRMAEGITLSRYPTAHPQQIPTFSLWWIGMLYDYWHYQPDTTYVKNKLAGMRQVLHFFSKYQQPDGSIAHPPYWQFTDWAEGNGWDKGVAPMDQNGNSAILDLQLCMAFEIAVILEQNLGFTQYEKLYRAKAAQLRETILSKYWDDNKALFADTGEKKYFSQHTNTLAVLANVLSDKEAKSLMKRTIADTTLTQATIYFKYYLHQAVAKAGLGDMYLNLLDDWHDQLANGLTTWAEISNHNQARSDCHAWGASPSIEFFRIVLGIDSGGESFNVIQIKPHLDKLTEASGKIPHPRGEITVSYTSRNGKWKADIEIPGSTTGEFIWKGKSYPLTGGKASFTGL